MGSRCEVSVKIPELRIPYIVLEPLLVNIDDLVIHEEIVESRLKGLMEKFLKHRAIDMPIVITTIKGSDKYMIIDGHHRWAAARGLGLAKIPAILVDYFDPRIRLETWYPGMIGDINRVVEELLKRNIDIEKCTYTFNNIISRNDVFSEDTSFIAMGKDNCFIISNGLEGQKIVTHILDKLCSNGSLSLAYYGEISDAIRDIVKNNLSYIFIRKALTKEEVVSKVKEGYIFPPKTTRHILPFYPAKIFTPLSELKRI